MSEREQPRPRSDAQPPAWLTAGDEAGYEVPSWAELPRLEVSDQVSGSMTFTFPKMPLLTAPPEPLPESSPPVVSAEEFTGLNRLARSRQGLPVETNGSARAASPPVVYGMVVRNGTAEAVHDVHIEHELPPGPRFLNADPLPRQDGRRLIWDVGTLQPGDKRRFKITVQPSRPEELPPDAAALFKVYQCLHSRTRVRRPKVTAKLRVPEIADISDTVPVGIDVRNAGGGPADDLRVLVAMPPGFSHGDWAALKFQRPALAPGESCTFEGETRLERPGEYELQAYVVGNGRVLAHVKAPIYVTGEAPKASAGLAAGSVDCEDAYLVFVVNEEMYALPVTGVAEVRRFSEGASGVIRLNDGSAPVIDLAGMLGGPPAPPGRIIITRSGVALAVDRTAGVKTLPPDKLRGRGPTPHAAATADLDGQLIVVLDPDKLPHPPRA